jgi:hypothetical protein
LRGNTGEIIGKNTHQGRRRALHQNPAIKVIGKKNTIHKKSHSVHNDGKSEKYPIHSEQYVPPQDEKLSQKKSRKKTDNIRTSESVASSEIDVDSRDRVPFPARKQRRHHQKNTLPNQRNTASSISNLHAERSPSHNSKCKTSEDSLVEYKEVKDRTTSSKRSQRPCRSLHVSNNSQQNNTNLEEPASMLMVASSSTEMGYGRVWKRH